MKIFEGVEATIESGKIILSADFNVLVLRGLRKQVESGAIDPIKGTDMDKEALLKAIDFLMNLKA